MEQQPYQQLSPGPGVFQGDRVLGIVGIVLFSCCALFGVFGAVSQAVGPGAEVPPELQPQAWETAVSLLANIGMLVGSIGLAMGRKWGMQLLVAMGTVSILYLIYSFLQFPAKEEAILRSLQEQAKSEEEMRGMEFGVRVGRFLMLIYAVPILLYVLYPALRLGGQIGPRPE